MLKSTDALIKDYSIQQNAHKATIAGIKKSITFHSILRVLCFLLEIAVFIFFVSVNSSTWQYVFGFGLIIPIVLFMVIVNRQSKLERQLIFNRNLLWVVENELQNLQNGSNGYDNGSKYVDGSHTFASDLDVFGDNSLYKLINRISTLKGMDLLADWFSNPYNLEVVEGRQAAVKELKKMHAETLNFRAYMKSQKLGALETIVAKVKDKLPGEVQFTNSAILRYLVRLVPFLMLTNVLFAIFLNSKIGYFLIVLAIINLIISYSFSKSVSKIHEGFSGLASSLDDFGRAIRWTEQFSWKSSCINQFFDGNIRNDKVSRQMQELASIINKFDARLNMIMNVFLNAFFLWDLKCALLLANWYKEHATTILFGLERLPKFEVLISLSTLHHNRPHWTFPVFYKAFKLDIEDMCHPLISEDVVISNNYKMPYPSVDIITGSNMAGKSTFLRAVGANTILAYMGAPAAAKSMRVSQLRILTYMRIIDALNTNTSTFKAELNRLKLILASIKSHPNCLVLIDEMLRGTNSGDKYEGSKAFILRMKELQVPTLFATHDLQLSDLEKAYQGQINNYHFDIKIEGDEMRFDYELKQGPCKVFNAEILLREIGLFRPTIL